MKTGPVPAREPVMTALLPLPVMRRAAVGATVMVVAPTLVAPVEASSRTPALTAVGPV